MKKYKKIKVYIIMAVIILSGLLIIGERYIKTINSEYISKDETNIRKVKLPTYARNELKIISERILKGQNPNTITFQFITDTHFDQESPYRITALKHFEEVKELSDLIKPQFIVHGGDIIDGYSPKEKSINSIEKATNYLLSNKRSSIFFIKGNHDDNSYYNVRNTPKTAENVIFPDEMYNLTVRKYEKDIKRDRDNPQGMYYYKDFEDKKIRVIILNTNDIPIIYKEDGTLKYNGINQYGISNNQLNWIANDALNFSDKRDKKEWKVIFFSHVSFVRDINYNRSIINGDVVMKIIESFKMGGKYTSLQNTGDFAHNVKVDYKSQGPMEVIAFISGHVHRDTDRKINGVNFITTLNSVPIQVNKSTVPERQINTKSENAFDTFVIDIKEKKIHAYRYGAGVDREFSY